MNPRLIAYTPAGKIAAAFDATTVEVYATANTAQLDVPIRLDRPVTAITFTPDGGSVATAEDDSTVRVWDAATGKPIGSPMKNDGPITNLTFSPDGHTVATWSGGNTLRLWNTLTSRPIGNPLMTDADVAAVAFSIDGRLVAAGGQDGGIQLWDVRGGEALPKLEGQGGKVTSLDFGPNETRPLSARLLSASTNGTVRVWPIAVPSPEVPKALCDKLVNEVSSKKWHDEEPGIGYQDVCDGLSRAEDSGEAT